LSFYTLDTAKTMDDATLSGEEGSIRQLIFPGRR
jgi:hypothetical protein